MPVHECSNSGRPGFKYGENGKCYTYEAGNKRSMAEAKRRAHVQAYAIEQSGYKENSEGDNISKDKKLEDEETMPEDAKADSEGKKDDSYDEPEDPSGMEGMLDETKDLNDSEKKEKDVEDEGDKKPKTNADDSQFRITFL
jgi:hypothetical protein